MHYANGNDVETTIIDGNIVMKERKVTTVDEDKVLDSGEKTSVEVWEDFNKSYRQYPEVAEQFKYFT